MSADLNNAIINLGKVIQDSRNPSAYDMQLMKAQAVKQQAEDNLISQSNIQDMQNLITESKGTLDPNRIDSLMQVIEGRYADSEDRVTIDTRNKAIATLARKRDVINGGLEFNKRQDELNEKLFGKVEFNEAGEVIGGGKFTSAALQGIHTDASTVDDMIRSEIFNQVDYGTFDAETAFEGYVETINSQLDGLNRIALKDLDKSNKQYDIDSELPSSAKIHLKDMTEQIQLGQVDKIVANLDKMINAAATETKSIAKEANKIGQKLLADQDKIDKRQEQSSLEQQLSQFYNQKGIDGRTFTDVTNIMTNWLETELAAGHKVSKLSFAGMDEQTLDNLFSSDNTELTAIQKQFGKFIARNIAFNNEHTKFNFHSKLNEKQDKEVIQDFATSQGEVNEMFTRIKNIYTSQDKSLPKSLQKGGKDATAFIGRISKMAGQNKTYNETMKSARAEVDKILNEVGKSEDEGIFGIGTLPDKYKAIEEHINNNNFESALTLLGMKKIKSDWVEDFKTSSDATFGFSNDTADSAESVYNMLTHYLTAMQMMQDHDNRYNQNSPFQLIEPTTPATQQKVETSEVFNQTKD